MKKTIAFSLFLVLLIIVFAYGVLSGITENTYFFDYLEQDSKQVNNYSDKGITQLQYKYKEFTNISGNSTTINGFPIEVWFSKNMDKSSKIAQHFLSKWKKKGLLYSKVKHENGDFVTSVDPKTKKFYGSISSGKYKNQSIAIPFSVDMDKKNIADIWDDDFPKKIKAKKGFHLRSQLGDKIFEKFYYVDDHTVGQNISYLKSQFKNMGWEFETKMENFTQTDEINLLCFYKKNKNCIISVAKADNDNSKTLVAILLGNNI